jgi:hypothetical protein
MKRSVRKMHKALAGALVGSLMAGSALANPQPLGVWDSTGRFVGNFTEGGVELPVKGVPIVLQFTDVGLGEELLFYYASSDCSGQPLIRTDTAIPTGSFLNNEVYYPGPASALHVASFSDQVGNRAPECGLITPAGEDLRAGPALHARLTAPRPPLCVSPTRKECQ